MTRKLNRAGIVGIALLPALAACGLKGPLYIPGEKQEEIPAQQAQSANPGGDPGAQPSQKKERERDAQPGSVTAPAPTDPDRPATPPAN